MECEFTFKHLKEIYKKALDLDYKICTLKEYFTSNIASEKILINRIDIDIDIIKAKKIAEIFNELGIYGTFFARLHAQEYNPFSFESKRIFKYIISASNEIGLHHECIDMEKCWKQNLIMMMKFDLSLLRKILETDVYGVSAHNGNTGYNNLDIWKNVSTNSFGLVYEAYDEQLWNKCVYVSDSMWTYWKIYKKGELINDDYRCLCEHLEDEHKLLYVLIHPETYV